MRLPTVSLPAIALDALAILLPVTCAGCGADDRGLCPSCRRRLAPQVTDRRLSDGTPVFSSLRYDGPVRRIILGLKEQGRTDVARPLGAALRLAVEQAASVAGGRVELTTMPTSRAAYRRRGYDPVRLLVRRAGFRVSSAVLADARADVGSRVTQKTLGLEARRSNLAGSLRAVGSLASRRFVLVDDVTTSGATLEEAARALRAADAEVLAVATLAFTPRRSLGE